MENKSIAVRVAAGDEPLQSVAGDHTLPPAVCLVGLIVLQRCVGAAVTNLLQVAKQVFYHRCVRLSGTGSQRGQQPCRQQQAQAFFQYSFHFLCFPFQRECAFFASAKPIEAPLVLIISQAHPYTQ